VPHPILHKAIGENGKNAKKMREIMRRRIKIIPIPKGIQDARRFIESIVAPVTFKNLEVTNNEIIINANRQSKAALIGREKRRLKEMQGIIKDFFGREFKVV